jgi:hypothetical protein
MLSLRHNNSRFGGEVLPDKDKGKININANPPGTLEIKEFENRMVQFRKGVGLKTKKKNS